MTTDQTEHSDTEQPPTDWWHRDHPTFTALSGFFTGLLFVTLVPAAVVGCSACCSTTTRPRSCSRSCWSPWSCRSALLVVPRTRRFGIYMVLGMVLTALVVLGVARSCSGTSSGT